MAIKHTIHDLTGFTVALWSSVPFGRIFIDRTAVQMKCKMNDHPVLATVATSSGNRTPLLDDMEGVDAPNRNVLLLAEGLRLTAAPQGEPIAMSEKIDLFGSLIMTPKGIGICGNFGDDSLRRHEPGRVGIIFENGIAELHGRAPTVACPSWKIAWMTARGDVVLSLTQRQGEAPDVETDS